MRVIRAMAYMKMSVTMCLPMIMAHRMQKICRLVLIFPGQPAAITWNHWMR